MSDHEQKAIEEHNRRELWRDVENHLGVAKGSLEQAQSALEDLGKTAWSDQLQPFVDALAAAVVEAAEAAA
jgi:hypothetical protein